MEAFKMVKVYLLEAEDTEEWAVNTWVKAWEVVDSTQHIIMLARCLWLIIWE